MKDELGIGSRSEKVVLEIMRIADRLACDVFEATLMFCEENEIEIEEFIECMDHHIFEILKITAIENRMVRKKHSGDIHQLPLSNAL